MGVPMTFTKSFLVITENPALSVLIWLILLLAALYFARKPFHRTIKAFSKVINNAMRFTASSVLLAEKRLVHRNREVLVTEGLENADCRHRNFLLGSFYLANVVFRGLKLAHLAIFNHTVNVTADINVLVDIAATAKSVSPFISFAIT